MSETTEKTAPPGRASYEARLGAKAARLGNAYGIGQFNRPWDRLDEFDQADEEAGAQAAIDARVAAAVSAADGGTVVVAFREPLDPDEIDDHHERWAKYVPGGVTLVIADGVDAIAARERPAGGDVRPREGEPGWHDVTCGECGEEFGTNFRVEEIECAECEARRCPHCGIWFGGES